MQLGLNKYNNAELGRSINLTNVHFEDDQQLSNVLVSECFDDFTKAPK